MSGNEEAVVNTGAGWRLKVGVLMFVLSIVLPVAGIPLVASLGLEGTMVASVSGVLLVGAEVLGLLAVAVMGKAGYQAIVARVLALLKRYGPPREVSPARYRVGLVLFGATLLVGWVEPYVSKLLPVLTRFDLAVAVTGDVLLIVSLFVLGGDFWAKVRALFVHSDKVVSMKEGEGAAAAA